MARHYKLSDDTLRELHAIYIGTPEYSLEDVCPLEVTPQTVASGFRRLGLEVKPARRPRLRKPHYANPRHLPTYPPIPKVSLTPSRGRRRRGRL